MNLTVKELRDLLNQQIEFKRGDFIVVLRDSDLGNQTLENISLDHTNLQIVLSWN